MNDSDIKGAVGYSMMGLPIISRQVGDDKQTFDRIEFVIDESVPPKQEDVRIRLVKSERKEIWLPYDPFQYDAIYRDRNGYACYEDQIVWNEAYMNSEYPKAINSDVIVSFLVDAIKDLGQREDKEGRSFLVYLANMTQYESTGPFYTYNEKDGRFYIGGEL